MPKATALQKANKAEITTDMLGEMFSAGAHYGLSRRRRHPSTMDYIFGLKDGVEIIDLEKTQALLNDAATFVEELGKAGESILFVTSKNEANAVVKNIAESINQPYVTGRWIGGTFTNFNNIRGRIRHLEDLEAQRDSGELEKYTKKEQLLLEREMNRLIEKFGGIRNMTNKPAAIIVVDSKEEIIAINEAKHDGVATVALCNVDCDVNEIDYPIVANDARAESIRFFLQQLRDAYEKGAGTTV
ncbi:MAG: 30S ribosomal protein S2 [Candidatus Paceibacterota bacterium]